ncbi:hypothetical protein DPMN_186728 [Dreissena polymorpha]|uniref:Uncharacterized protein n=1 Tax=Dreissena polymorpha TaxID=45954 RepID=A0A9D4DM06_DREPO|nr:hypothetical protein DPMN_186728 [Dreissena polymorpha]
MLYNSLLCSPTDWSWLQTTAQIKLSWLDEQYRVVNHCDVSAWPQDICQIAPSEFAVTVDAIENTHEVVFITVINNQVVTGRKLKLKHNCVGITYHQENLFVTSSTTLYK